MLKEDEEKERDKKNDEKKIDVGEKEGMRVINIRGKWI